MPVRVLSLIMSQEAIGIIEAKLDNPLHQEAVLRLVDAYSRDAMGDGEPLSNQARTRLISGLREHPTTLILLAYKGEEAVGIAVCFRGFSTFAARPLMNIHDLAVLPGHRGLGIGRQLLEAVEEKSRAMDCCKLTLEVLQENKRARAVYAAAGFGSGVSRNQPGEALFLSKRL